MNLCLKCEEDLKFEGGPSLFCKDRSKLGLGVMTRVYGVRGAAAMKKGQELRKGGKMGKNKETPWLLAHLAEASLMAYTPHTKGDRIFNFLPT